MLFLLLQPIEQCSGPLSVSGIFWKVVKIGTSVVFPKVVETPKCRILVPLQIFSIGELQLLHLALKNSYGFVLSKVLLLKSLDFMILDS